MVDSYADSSYCGLFYRCTQFARLGPFNALHPAVIDDHQLILRICGDQSGISKARTRQDIARVLATHDAKLPIDEDRSPLRALRYSLIVDCPGELVFCIDRACCRVVTELRPSCVFHAPQPRPALQ